FNKEFIFPQIILELSVPICDATIAKESFVKFNNFNSFSLSNNNSNTFLGDRKKGSLSKIKSVFLLSLLYSVNIKVCSPRHMLLYNALYTVMEDIESDIMVTIFPNL